MLFGVYLLALLLYGVLTFRDCPEEAESLQQVCLTIVSTATQLSASQFITNLATQSCVCVLLALNRARIWGTTSFLHICDKVDEQKLHHMELTLQFCSNDDDEFLCKLAYTIVYLETHSSCVDLIIVTSSPTWECNFLTTTAFGFYMPFAITLWESEQQALQELKEARRDLAAKGLKFWTWVRGGITAVRIGLRGVLELRKPSA